MMKWISRLGTNQRLALVALVLGAGALFARPMAAGTVRVNAPELAAELQREAGIQPADLADRIIKGTTDFRLIDLRDEQAFASYHVPGAENVPLTALADSGIGHNEKIVLYSDDGTRSAQAWFVLAAQGFRSVSVLRGGLEGWKQGVLFPVLKQNPSPAEQVDNERRRQVSAHFGGAPRTGGDGAIVAGGSLPAMPTPKVEVPSLPAGASAGATAKKKKEGC